MADIQQDVEGVATTNQGYENASALQIRLDTTEILEKIEYFLRGLEVNTYVNPETGVSQLKLVPMGQPKANKIGIQSLLNVCRSLINPQVVQGNYKEQQYIAFIKEKRIEIISMLIINFYEWELPYDNCAAEITDFIMNMVEPFLSRTINNQERLSYAQTIRTNETNTLRGGGSPLDFFGGKKE